MVFTRWLSKIANVKIINAKRKKGKGYGQYLHNLRKLRANIPKTNNLTANPRDLPLSIILGNILKLHILPREI